MEPQITISEKLFKRLSTQQTILTSLLMTFISFVWDIYKDFYKDVVTLSSINSALIKSIILGTTFFVVYSLLCRKYLRKQIIENDNAEKTKSQKVFPIIISSFALLVLFCVILLLCFNHWRFAYIVFWVGGVFCFIALVIMLIFLKKKK